VDHREIIIVQAITSPKNDITSYALLRTW